ncbi:hypothetical protein L5515_006653 [Caenorhabditis briggsae]|uniref:SCP domain-containing protein n=1 Tax=Caenorhabditis briggsae TaxID=6238 RepID=A0AAE9A576_CAEBR|nr:hypothetical protein L3Y34_006827 [Caenorhabditis briggsae]UMM33041.1 hypothetical protein L5515_006653 [Caenorhabditis briggsae]
MAWAKTGSVGCGIKFCGPVSYMNNNNVVVVVCRYDVRADDSKKQINQEGDTCSACPSPTQCKRESGLCV